MSKRGRHKSSGGRPGGEGSLSALAARLSRWRRALLPPPREPVTWRRAAPLLLFLAVFGGACLLVELLDVVVWTWPRAFALLVVTPWVWWMAMAGGGGLRGWRAAVSLWLRLALVGLLVAVLAEPRAVRTDDALSVVFVLDRSQSIRPEAAEQAVNFIARVGSERPEGDEVGLVTFGRDAVVELPPSEWFPFEGMAAHVDRGGTSLEQALTLGAAVLPDEHDGRLVLISDGVETQGHVRGVLDQIRSRGIAVDVLPIQYDYDKEVLVERLELPRSVKAGESYEAVVILWAAQRGEGTLTLLENGQRVFADEVTFEPGKNRYAIPIYLRDPGHYEYTAVIEPGPGQDSWPRNNRAIGFVYLQGEGRVLVVTGPDGDPRDYQPLVRAMRQRDRQVDVISGYELASDPLALLPYDCIMAVNVGADVLTGVQMRAVRQAVEEMGAGFVMIGGEHSFGPGGYHRTEIEEILPVTMDVTQKKVLPKNALAICLHTCEFPDGNTWAKRITKAAIKVLSEQDEVGVLVYDWAGADKWLFPLTPVSQYNTMAKAINGAQIGDMPAFGPTMQLAYQALAGSDAASKHMIIISDGDPQPPTPALLNQFLAARITVSTVAVFPHGNSTQVMQQIAGVTGGRFYFPQDPNQLPQIFIKEAKTLRRSMIQNKTFTPTAGFPSPILKGLDALPPLHGYVITTAKDRAQVVLEVPQTEDQEPILATIRQGLGKTAAFTSDLSPNWAAQWMDWSQYEAFVHQLVVDVSRVAKPSTLQLSAYAAGGRGHVVVEDYAPEPTFLTLTAQVQGPRQQVDAILEQTGPRRYEGTFPLQGEGRYIITARGEGAERSERVIGGMAVAYDQEFLRLRANPLVMEEIAQRTGGRVLTGEETGREVFIEQRDAVARSMPVFDWFLIFLACAVPLDVAVRRVQIDMALIRQWLATLSPRAAPSGETMAGLKRRKQAVGQTLERTDPALAALRARQQKQAAAAPQAPVQPAPESPSKADAKPSSADAPSTSTTGQLLARRRALREQQDQDNQP